MERLQEGLEYLKKGSYLTLISFGLLVAAFFMFIVMTFGGVVSGIVLSVLLVFISFVVGLIGFIRLYQAAGKLAEEDSRYGVGKIGMIIQIIGLALLVFGFVLAAVGLSGAIIFFGPGLIVIFVAFLAILAGGVLFGLMLLRMEEINADFKIAGVLYMVGAVANLFLSGLGTLLIAISLLLTYRASSKALSEL